MQNNQNKLFLLAFYWLKYQNVHFDLFGKLQPTLMTHFGLFGKV